MPRRKGKAKVKEVAVQKQKTTVNFDNHEKHFYKIITKIQKDQTIEKMYIKEMKLIYNGIGHNEFMEILTKTICVAINTSEDNPNADAILNFICNFLATYKDEVDTNPCKSAFEWVLESDGKDPHIRFRLCQFVNTLLSSLGPDAELDDTICDKILTYMLNRLKNLSPHVRAQAIYALQRLQSPSNPEDVVIKFFSYHLKADPSAKVRKAVISNIARNAKTIPLILERLQDIDEKVRRHTYVEMMKGFPVKSFRVAQRLKVLESGFNDESKSIRKIVSFLMLKEWFISFNENYISFLTALKLNGSDSDLKRYYKTMKLVLPALFEKQPLEKLLAVLTFSKSQQNTDGDDDENNESEDEIEVEFIKCFPYEKMTLEHSTYWLNLVVFFYERSSNDIDLVLPEITTFCAYLIKLYEYKTYLDRSVDEWEQVEQAHTLNNLIEIFKYFDYTDEIGRENLINFICKILKEWDVHEQSTETLIRIMENIVKNNTDRFQLINNIIHELLQPESFEFIGDRPSMKAILQTEGNANLQVLISQLKVNIMDLKEHITNCIAEKDYESAETKQEELNSLQQQYKRHFTPLIKLLPESEAQSISLATEKISSKIILKCFKIIYFMVSSHKVNSLTPAVCHLYNFIRRHTESNQTDIRNWALKCGTAFGLLYKPYSHDFFIQLRKQFFNTTDLMLWETSIRAIFDMLTKYGLEHFDIADKNNRNSTSKNSRQLYRGNADYLSQDNDGDSNQGASNTAILPFLAHLFDTCEDANITNTMIEGYCLLCLYENIAYPEIITKLLIRYFDSDTDDKANQLLGVFFKTLVAKGKSGYLEAALLPTVREIFDSGYESTLGEVKPENVIRFILNATKPIYSLPGINIHHSFAETFLKEIYDNVNVKKEYVKVLSAQLLNLEIKNDTKVKQELQVLAEKILEFEDDIEEKVLKYLKNFILHLKGVHVENTITFSSTRLPCDKSDDGASLNGIDEENENEEDGENIEIPESSLDESRETGDEIQDEKLLDTDNIDQGKDTVIVTPTTPDSLVIQDEPEEETFKPFIPANDISKSELEEIAQITDLTPNPKSQKIRELKILRRSNILSPVSPRLTRSSLKAKKTTSTTLDLKGSQTINRKSKTNSKTPVRKNFDNLTILAPDTPILTNSASVELTPIEIPETQITTREKSVINEGSMVTSIRKRGPLFPPEITLERNNHWKQQVSDFDKSMRDLTILAPNSPELQQNKSICDENVEMSESHPSCSNDIDIDSTGKMLRQEALASKTTSNNFVDIILPSSINTRSSQRSISKNETQNKSICDENIEIPETQSSCSNDTDIDSTGKIVRQEPLESRKTFNNFGDNMLQSPINTRSSQRSTSESQKQNKSICAENIEIPETQSSCSNDTSMDSTGKISRQEPLESRKTSNNFGDNMLPSSFNTRSSQRSTSENQKQSKSICDEHIEIPETQSSCSDDTDMDSTGKIVRQEPLESRKISYNFGNNILPSPINTRSTPINNRSSPINTRSSLRSTTKKEKITNAMRTPRKQGPKPSSAENPHIPTKSIYSTSTSRSNFLTPCSSSQCIESQSLFNSEPRRSVRLQKSENVAGSSKTIVNNSNSSEKNSARKSNRITSSTTSKPSLVLPR